MGQLMSVGGRTEATRPKVAEFFAGIGLVRMGLEAAGFDVRWSNDIDPDKQAMYLGHFARSPGHTFLLADVEQVKGDDMPEDLALAWASFPCIYLSLAGWRRGLDGKDSGCWWSYGNMTTLARPLRTSPISSLTADLQVADRDELLFRRHQGARLRQQTSVLAYGVGTLN
jgi:C-5 cytosine-specific DNA methylase